MFRDSVVIIGSGLMGSGIAAKSALAGNKTILVDEVSAKAKAGVENALLCIEELCENGLVDLKNMKQISALLSYTTDRNRALESARLVIEAINENLELKQQIFKEVDAVLPDNIIIATNTSGLRVTDIAAYVKHPERTVTAHFWFPAHLVPLVEVVMGDHTSLALANELKEELIAWGKAPVLVKRDLPGQLANRILQAVIREAVNIVEIGLASPEDVDTAVKMGMGIRFPAWGPLEHIDAVGLDLAVFVQNTVLPGISDAKEASGVLTELVEDGNMGYRTGKGIYDWSAKSMEELALDRNRFIIEALKILEK